MIAGKGHRSVMTNGAEKWWSCNTRPRRDINVEIHHAKFGNRRSIWYKKERKRKKKARERITNCAYPIRDSWPPTNSGNRVRDCIFANGEKRELAKSPLLYVHLWHKRTLCDETCLRSRMLWKTLCSIPINTRIKFPRNSEISNLQVHPTMSWRIFTLTSIKTSQILIQDMI